MAIPQNYTEAINSPESQEWKKAMDKEIKSLKEKNTYTITLPTGKNVVGGRWLYTIKENTNNTRDYNARYVAKGFSQIKDLDYHETYAPTTKMTKIRTLMQFVAQYDLIVHKWIVCIP